MTLRPYQKLIAWQEAHRLCIAIYKITLSFPSDERFSVSKQMRRSASSIPTNIAEGNVRRTTKEQARFLEIALASLEELHYQCLLSKELGYLEEDIFIDFHDKIQRTGYLIGQLRRSRFTYKTAKSSQSS